MVCGDRVVWGDRVGFEERYAGEGADRMFPAARDAGAGEEADGVRAALKGYFGGAGVVDGVDILSEDFGWLKHYGVDDTHIPIMYELYRRRICF